MKVSFDSRFLLDLDIAAPKITIPTDFQPDNTNTTRLMLDLGNLLIRTQVFHTNVAIAFDITWFCQRLILRI